MSGVNRPLLGEAEEYTDLSERGLAKFSFQIKKGWTPAISRTMAPNLLHVLEMVDGFFLQTCRSTGKLVILDFIKERAVANL